MGLLDGKIAKDIAKAIISAKLAQPATLIRIIPGNRTGGEPTGGTNATTSNIACKGIVSLKTHTAINGTSVQAGDRVIVLFGATTQGIEPGKGDRITIKGKTLPIISVEVDAAGATFTCLCRG